MSNDLLTQHESFQYASAFERWLSGMTSLGNLQIRRVELDQKLGLRDSSGNLIEELISEKYLHDLEALDSFTKDAPPGLLPPSDQVILRSKSDDALNSFIMDAREMVESNPDGSTNPLATLFRKEITRQNYRNTALLAVLALIFLVSGFVALSHLKDLRKIRVQMEIERQKLDDTNLALKEIDNELQLRLDRERIERSEHEWLDKTVRSMSSQFKSTIDPDAIAESLVEGLGRALDVDVVLFYSFPNFPMPRLWKQWHRRSDTNVDGSLVVENESELFTLVENLWSKKRTIVVNDSHLINIAQDPNPKLAELSQMSARSWILVPLGAGTEILGCFGVGMFEKPRVWSGAEIELVEKVVSEVADVFIQARLFRQSMQIAENDAEVNRLVELDRVKNDLIENMNHELRTPLSSIIGYLAVIMSDT
ncbi:MAG: GAF domain-containing protein, partial [Actinomycetota bacterium]